MGGIVGSLQKFYWMHAKLEVGLLSCAIYLEVGTPEKSSRYSQASTVAKISKFGLPEQRAICVSVNINTTRLDLTCSQSIRMIDVDVGQHIPGA